jgi:hypothetical protein
MRFGIGQSWNPEDIKQILEAGDGGNYIVFYEAEDGHTKVEEVRARKDEVNVENLLDRIIRGAEEK